MTLATRFEEYVASHNLFTHDDRLLLTVSGGVDSMVMLSLFHEAGYRFGVAHCNFCLRGVEGDEDESYKDLYQRVISIHALLAEGDTILLVYWSLCL